jgi:8-oxo-dGTP diphosphatase
MKNKTFQYPLGTAPITAVDVIIFTIKENKLEALLIKIKYGPLKGMWAFPGWRIKIHESLDEAAAREVYENTGIKNTYLEQLYSFGSIKRDPAGRVVSIAYFALVNSNNVKLKPSPKYSAIKWFSVNKIPRLAYDHKEMLNYAFLKLRNKLEYSNVVYSLLPKKFTLTDFQNVYEIIFRRKTDKRNFRKKTLSLDLIKRVGEKRGESYRPAALYSFKKRKFATIKII